MPAHYRTGIESIEVAARRDFFAAAPAAFGAAVIDLPGAAAALRVAALPTPIMNRVVGLPRGVPLKDETFEQIKQVFRERDVPRFWLHAWDLPGGEALRDSLLARGCQPQGAWIKFECDLTSMASLAAGAAQPSPLKVRPARDDEFGLAGQVMCDSFGMPPLLVPWMAGLARRPGWQVYFACDDNDAPVATGSLFIDGPRAWLGMGATLPAARRQGSQQALLACRLGAARAAGCTVAGSEADASVLASLNNLRRAGFQEVGLRLNYLCES